MTNADVVDRELSTGLYSIAALAEKMRQGASGRAPPASRLVEQRPAIRDDFGPVISGGVCRQRIGGRSYYNRHSSRQERTAGLACRRRELVMPMEFLNCTRFI